MKTKPQEAKKTAKTLKGQLFGALSMMLVASIALGTSTYAWFINNRTVEVENMELQVSTSTSLLVAVGKKASIAAPTTSENWTGYKSLVTNQDITGVTPAGAVAGAALDTADWRTGDDADALKLHMLTLPMVPASISNQGLLATATGDSPALQFFATDNHVTNGKLDQFDPVKIGIADTTVGMGPVKRIPLKFSASSDLDVYFGKESVNGIANLVSSVTADTDGKQATAIRSALRVAVVPQATTTFADAASKKPVIFQFDDGTVGANHLNNTDYSHVAAVSNVFPNPDDGTATSSASSVTEALTNIQAPTTGKYAAIKTVNADTKYVTDVAIQQTQLPANSKFWATVTGNGGAAEVTAPEAGTPIFKVKAGEDRMVDVYIWLEGTDEDCLNELSGYQFNLQLPFAAVETAPTAP